MNKESEFKSKFEDIFKEFRADGAPRLNSAIKNDIMNWLKETNTKDMIKSHTGLELNIGNIYYQYSNKYR